MNEKAELRNKISRKLKDLDQSSRSTLEKSLTNKLVTSTYWENASVIGITVSYKYEWDTRQAIKKAWAQGKTVCVPKCSPKTRGMTFYQLHSFDELESSYYGLMEPDPEKTFPIDKNRMELIVVPGLVFDAYGYRIGHGGGYYDRFLPGFNGKTIALAGSFQMVDKIPRDNYDIAVEHIVTEKGIIF